MFFLIALVVRRGGSAALGVSWFHPSISTCAWNDDPLAKMYNAAPRHKLGKQGAV
ncbi:MAG TPA: hypothetical protein VKU82_01435 [Planctomycetaceae bacterium]|nr:hypothetical protein [Planctomycetaceae bacterium]